MKNIKTLIFFYLLTSLWASAQIKYEERIEIEEQDEFSNYQTFQFGENGIVVTYEKDLKTGDLQEYYFDFYNKDLVLNSTKKIALSKKLTSEFTCGTDNTGHALLLDKKNNYALVSIDVSKNETKKVTGVFPKKLTISEMIAMGDFVYIYGVIKKNKTMLTINWKTGVSKFISLDVPNVKAKKVSIQGFQAHKATNEVYLFLQVKPDKKTSDVFMLQADAAGKKKSLVNISDKTESHILSTTASALDEDNFIFMGTYSEKYSSYSSGFYFSKSVGQKMDYIKFYPFSELKNFLDYLPVKQQKKYDKKISKKKAKGKTVDVLYQMVIHDLIKQSDGYVIIGECYYPTYRRETYNEPTTINGKATTVRKERTVFDGFKYTHAMVVKMDFSGKLIWNKNFKMMVGEKPLRVVKFLKVNKQDNDEIGMVYVDGSKIVSKSISNKGEVLRDVEQEVIITSKSGDKIKYTDSELKPWYDNYFLAYGYQRIKNKEDKSVKRMRNVFYLNKVKYETN